MRVIWQSPLALGKGSWMQGAFVRFKGAFLRRAL